MNHQDIIDRLEALGRERGAAYDAERARIKKETESLQELCGGLGHFFAKATGAFAYGDKRFCVFCSCAEPAKVA